MQNIFKLSRISFVDSNVDRSEFRSFYGFRFNRYRRGSVL